MSNRPYPGWVSRLFVASMAMLAVTGMFQMPLGKRYYFSEIPGLAWLADFYVVHKVHYVAAAVLLFLVGVVVVNWLLLWRDKLELTRFGLARVIIVGGLIVSGGLRVARNLPDMNFSPGFVLLFDLVHLGLTMVLGGVALVALIKGKSAYARYR